MMQFTSSSWCGLQWTQWISFSDLFSFKYLPSSPGLYRIRVVNDDELFYIGETGRNLRERLGDLRRNTMKVFMPYNDPHTAAPSLWAWRHAEGFEFECSATCVALSEDPHEARKRREGLEFYLLWQYRLEFGSSTRCNHGRFHPRYIKSTDRKKGLKGYRLPDSDPHNIAGGPSLPPLQLTPDPCSNTWMGLSWNTPHLLEASNVQQVTTSPGVYKIFYPEVDELLYIGESKNLRSRLLSHTRKIWGDSCPYFSYVPFPDDTPTYQRHEIENDLLGGFYAITQKQPKFQLIGHS